MNHKRFLGFCALMLSVFVVGCDGDSGGSILDPNTQNVPLSGGTFTYQNNKVSDVDRQRS